MLEYITSFTATTVKINIKMQYFEVLTSVIYDTLKERHCVESVQIRSFLRSVCSLIRAEYEELRSISLRIQSECEKIRTRKNSVFGKFSCSANRTFTASYGKMNLQSNG